MIYSLSSIFSSLNSFILSSAICTLYNIPSLSFISTILIISFFPSIPISLAFSLSNVYKYLSPTFHGHIYGLGLFLIFLFLSSGCLLSNFSFNFSNTFFRLLYSVSSLSSFHISKSYPLSIIFIASFFILSGSLPSLHNKSASTNFITYFTSGSSKCSSYSSSNSFINSFVLYAVPSSFPYFTLSIKLSLKSLASSS